MKTLLSIAMILRLAEFAPAAIVSISNNANCYAEQIDGTGGGVVVYANGAIPGPSVSFHDPLHVTDSGGRHWATEVLFEAWVSASTPTYAQVEGYFVGSAEISGTSTPEIIEAAETYAIDVLSFTLDAPGTVSLINYNVGISTSYSSPPMAYQTKLTLDGVDYQINAADATFTLPVGVGTHTASFTERAEAFKVNWPNPAYSSSGLMQSQHQIQVSSVPEPSSAMVWVLGASLLLGARRSRA